MCTCKTKNKSYWWVRQFKACWHYIGKNRTYRRAKSSLIECRACGRTWRTSANYVDGLEKKHQTPYIFDLANEIVWKSF